MSVPVPIVVPIVVPMVMVPAPPHRNFRSPLCPDQSRLGTPDSTFKRFGLFRNPRPSRRHHQEVRLLIPSWRVFGICPPRGYDNQVCLLIPSWRDLKLAADISVVTVFPASSVLNLTSHSPSGTQSWEKSKRNKQEKISVVTTFSAPLYST